MHVIERVRLSNLFLGGYRVCVCERVTDRSSTTHASLDAVTLSELSLAYLHTNTFLVRSGRAWYIHM